MAEIKNQATLDSKPFQSELQRLQGHVQGFSTKAASGLAKAFAVGAIVSYGKSTLSAADSIDNLSGQLKLGVESVQSMDVKLKEAGLSAESLQTGMSGLRQKMAEAVAGGKVATGQFKELGISVDMLSKMTPEQALESVTKAMYEGRDNASVMAAATDVLGARSIKLQNVLMELGEKGFSALNAEMLKSGQIMSVDAVKSFDKMDEGLSRALNKMNNKTRTFFAEALIGWQAYGAAAKAFVEMRDIDDAMADAYNRATGGGAAGADVQTMTEGVDVDAKAAAEKAAKDQEAMDKRAAAFSERVEKARFDALTEESKIRKLIFDIANDTNLMQEASGMRSLELQERIFDANVQLQGLQEAMSKRKQKDDEKAAEDQKKYLEEIADAQAETGISGYGSGAALEKIGGFSGGGEGGMVATLERQIRISEAIYEVNKRMADTLARNPPLTVGGI
jgi:hypothetical protein